MGRTCKLHAGRAWEANPGLLVSQLRGSSATHCATVPPVDSYGQKTLTQPAVINVSFGETAMLGCNIVKDENYIVTWMKQVPGSPPQHILYMHYSYSAPKEYGTGFSSSRFTSKGKSNKIDYQLIISNVEASDSAVYYCYTWDGSVSTGVSQ
uniref:Ig-like domain-containing protein n=1 Tax=Erpetoichthys calabaricus TaxID=27687 RepID=A0A8C4SHD1_ERPCA